MKKLLCTTILFFIFYSSNAQVKEYGIRLGGSLAFIDGSAFNDYKSWGNFSYTTSSGGTMKGSNGFLISLMPTFFSRYRLSDKFFFQPEIGISFNGISQNNDSDDKYYTSNSNVKIRLTYLQIPLLLGYKFNENNYSPFITAGLTPAFLLSANAKSEVNTIDKSTGKKINTTSENSGSIDKKMDIGLTIGGGILSFPTMPTLGADIRLSVGLVNLIASPNGLYFDDKTAANNSISLAVYYRFNQ